MRYLLMIFGDDASWDHATAADINRVAAAHMAFQTDVIAMGGAIEGNVALGRLHETITLRDDLLTDGPFLESKEMLGGFYLLQADDLDHALAIAKRCPAELGVEIRPIRDLSLFGFQLTIGRHKEQNAMKFLVMIYGDEQRWETATPEEFASTMDQHRAFAGKVEALGGTILGGEALETSPTATTIRDDVVTDGPFVESKEAFGGYYLIEAESKEQAIAIGRLCPTDGYIEVRPVWDTSNL